MKIEKLLKLNALTPISKLTKDQVKELQGALNELGYNAGATDGSPGPKTQNAWLGFLAKTFGTNMILIGPDAAKLLREKLGTTGDTGDTTGGENLGLKPLKLVLIKQIQVDTAIDRLSRAELKELQTALSWLGYPVGDIDGLIGAKTRTAWAEFEKDVFGGNKLSVGPVSVDILQSKLDKIGVGRIHDFSTNEGTIEAIKSACRGHEIGLKPQIAYVLATVEWETAKTFKPVREAFWLSEDWRKDNLVYFPFYGRGYVQLTWEKNYKKYSDILSIDLIKNADLAMDENVALFILVHGFKTGTFTGRKITDYIDASKTDFVSARRGINGTDHDEDIAKIAEKYLSTL